MASDDLELFITKTHLDVFYSLYDSLDHDKSAK